MQEYQKLASAAARKLHALKIQPTQDCYWYLMDIVDILRDRPELLASTHKLLFPEVARKHQCSTAAVESALRRAIHNAWKQGLLPSSFRPAPADFLSELMRELAEELTSTC